MIGLTHLTSKTIFSCFSLTAGEAVSQAIKVVYLFLSLYVDIFNSK